MTVTWGHTTAPPNALPRAITSAGVTAGVYNKEDCSLLNPSIIVNSSVVSLASYTHFYLSSTQRWYSITDIEALSGERCRVHGKIDVMATYGERVKATAQWITRTADGSSENSLVPDSKRPITNPTVDSFTTLGSYPAGGCWILTVLAGSEAAELKPFTPEHDETEGEN